MSDKRNLTPQEKKHIAAWSKNNLEALDQLLLSCTDYQWKKVALVVAKTMMKTPDFASELPDIFYLQRIDELIGQGKLVYNGDLFSLRNCEVRRSAELL